MSVNSQANAGTPFLPHEHVIFTDLDGEGVLVDLHARQFYQLNETASLVWRGLAEGRTVVDIARAMAESYEVTVEHAQSSVETVVGRFIAHHWVNKEQANG
jgi:hypothetical protein